MTIITAHIPAKTVKGQTKTFSFPAHDRRFEMDDEGRWAALVDGERIPATEADVIHDCRKATNWHEIKAAHFPMAGFSS